LDLVFVLDLSFALGVDLGVDLALALGLGLLLVVCDDVDLVHDLACFALNACLPVSLGRFAGGSLDSS
jgi:hypothetical protein